MDTLKLVVCEACRLTRAVDPPNGWTRLEAGSIHDATDHTVYPHLAAYLAALGRPVDHLRRPGWPLEG